MSTPFSTFPILESFALESAATTAGRFAPSASATINVTGSRSGRSGCLFSGLNVSAEWIIPTGTTLYVGYNFKGGLFSDTFGDALIFLQPTSGTVPQFHIGTSVTPGSLIISVNDPSTGLGTIIATFDNNGVPFEDGTWYFLEMSVHTTLNTITFVVRAEGLVVCSVTHTFGSNWSSPDFGPNLFVGGPIVPAGHAFMSDVYVNTSGFYGPGVALALKPAGVGNYSQWTSSSANPNWQNADIVPPPTTTPYNSAAATGDKDSYKLTQPTAGGPVSALQGSLWTEADAAGSATVQCLYRSNGSDQLGQAFTPLNGTYEYAAREGSETSPFTGKAWTFGEVVSLEFGPERTDSPAGANNIRVAQAAVEIWMPNVTQPSWGAIGVGFTG